MAKTASFNRKENHTKRQKRGKSQKVLQFTLIGVGVILMGLSAFWLSAGRSNTPAGTGYRPEDIVYERPLHAIHEMEGAKLNEIPFLPQNGPQPEIAFAEEFYDFGAIGAQDVVTYEFVIFNRGDAPLTISRAYTTCGCTTADFTATVIPPGKVSVMTLTLDAGYHDVAGQTVRRGVIIESNDPKNPETELWTQAAVLNK